MHPLSLNALSYRRVGILSGVFLKLNSMELPQEGKTHEGSFFHKMLEKHNITFTNAAEVIKMVERFVNLLSKDAKRAKLHKSLQLNNLHSILKLLFREEFEDQAFLERHYRVLSLLNV